MLQFLIIWITTIAATIGADVSLAFKMIKDIADCGYKIKLDRMKEVSEALNPNVKQMNNFIKLIPIINLMKSFSDLVEYSKVRNKVLDEFSVLDCIEEMTDLERESYMLRPTAINAIVIYAKSKIKEEESDKKVTITFKENDEEGKIIFKLIERDNKQDIFIIGSEGVAKNMTIGEQKRKIIEIVKLINNSINLSNFGKQSSNYKTRKERIDELNRFKKELLDSKNINNEKDNNSGEQKRK